MSRDGLRTLRCLFLIRGQLDTHPTRYSPLIRPAGGVNHSDSNLVETGELSAKKALR